MAFRLEYEKREIARLHHERAIVEDLDDLTRLRARPHEVRVEGNRAPDSNQPRWVVIQIGDSPRKRARHRTHEIVDVVRRVSPVDDAIALVALRPEARALVWLRPKRSASGQQRRHVVRAQPDAGE